MLERHTAEREAPLILLLWSIRRARSRSLLHLLSGGVR
jgi:hypothetical protein